MSNDTQHPSTDPMYRAHRRVMVLWLITLLLLGGWFVWREVWPIVQGPAGEPRTVTPRAELNLLEKTNIRIFENASPSVVYINTAARRVNPWTRRVYEMPRGAGSGFVWDERGHVITNYHVIRNATSAQVVMHDQRRFNAQLVGVSPAHDLAVLKINASPGALQPLPIGTSHDLKVGQQVFAIGNPFGLDQTLTTGVISALDREIPGVGDQPIEEVIQTDAAINPGNSGGPLLDSAGRLMGVNTAIYSPTGASAGIGFAVPVDTVNRVVPRIIAEGEYERPKLGISMNDRLSAQVLSQLDLDAGVLVLAVAPGSPADNAGLQPSKVERGGAIVPGDVIQKIGDRDVGNANDLMLALDRYDFGDTVTLTIWRDGEQMEVDVTLEKWSP